KIFLTYNINSVSNENLKNKQFRKFISNAILNKYQGEYSLSNSLFEFNNLTNKNETNIIKNYSPTESKLTLLCPEEDTELVNLSKIIVNILLSENLNITVEILPYYKYLERMFYTKDFDLAIVKYSFGEKILSLYSLFYNDKINFSAFIDNNQIYKEFILSLLNENNFNDQNIIINDFQNLISNESVFGPFFSNKKQYILNGIYNFKNSNDVYNLITIEHILKKKIKK
ncbi:MAG TPA: hypothetical protein PK771_14650, partial [Spirochaetota bacterium]|nr:hypothetical protein [Spirochaetota bacterium]